MSYVEKQNYGRYYEDFTEGMAIEHWPNKTITEAENHFFSLLTMNHHPVHVDKEYAAEQHHGKILVVGPLVISLVVGMTVKDVSGRAIANLGYKKISHDAPVFIGDTIRAETEVCKKRDSESDPGRGIVTVQTRAFNQRDETVLTLQRTFLVPKKSEK